MKNHEEIALILARERAAHSPSQLASIMLREAAEPRGSFFLINVFAEAFPEIPLRHLIQASRWHGVTKGGMSDEKFDQILSPWLTPGSGSHGSDKGSQLPETAKGE